MYKYSSTGEEKGQSKVEMPGAFVLEISTAEETQFFAGNRLHNIPKDFFPDTHLGTKVITTKAPLCFTSISNFSSAPLSCNRRVLRSILYP